jgi:two-component system phosphate regulon sensor histidine kinase PhoR
LIITVFVTLLMTVFAFQTIKKWHVRSLTGDLNRLGTAVEPVVLNMLTGKSTAKDVDSYVKELGKSLSIRLTVILPDGKVLADSLSEPASMENHGDRPEIKRAFTGDVSENIRFSTTMMSDMLYLAVPVKQGDIVSAVLRLSLFIEDIEELRKEIEWRIAAVALILILVSLILTYIVSRGIARPVIELADASQKVAAGNFNVRVFPRDKGELGELAVSFNEMILRQKELFEDMTSKREELTAIITSINEGLLVLDKEDTIILTNRSFNKIVDTDELEGKKYWEVFRSSEFYEMIQRLRKEGNRVSGEIHLNGHDFIASCTMLLTRDTIVVTLHDITERKKLETIKRDFVSNVSHELKTPLTSIKGFAETLMEDADGESRKYVDIILKNAERMVRIVQDLLILSRLEEKPDSIAIEVVNLRELIQDTMKQFDPVVKERELEMALDVGPGQKLVQGDRFGLEDLFTNLLDNSVRYTEKGGVWIRLSIEDHWAVCEIRDTGIGIEQSHLERIFERFYVVDASRSRATGGTGLGLSIVKHIVMLHKGEITVKSIPKVGTTFLVKLPLFRQ